MIQRLFLDGVDLERGGRGVTEAVELAALVDANEAEAALPLDRCGSGAGIGSSGRGRPDIVSHQRASWSFGLLSAEYSSAA